VCRHGANLGFVYRRPLVAFALVACSPCTDVPLSCAPTLCRVPQLRAWSAVAVGPLRGRRCEWVHRHGPTVVLSSSPPHRVCSRHVLYPMYVGVPLSWAPTPCSVGVPQSRAWVRSLWGPLRCATRVAPWTHPTRNGPSFRVSLVFVCALFAVLLCRTTRRLCASSDDSNTHTFRPPSLPTSLSPHLTTERKQQQPATTPSPR
jgi:hypothetical protein